MTERVLETGNEPTRLTARFVMLMCDRASVISNPDDVTEPARIDVSQAALVLADWVLNDYDDWKAHNGSPWPSGSSVPEAARAAERFADDEVRNGPKNGEECPRCTGEYAQPCAYHEGYDDGASTIRARDLAAHLEEDSERLREQLEAVRALCQDANGYTTHDQIEKLGEPPWRGMDANLIAWERAHGHDVRLGCDRTECLLLIDPEDLRAALASPGEAVEPYAITALRGLVERLRQMEPQVFDSTDVADLIETQLVQTGPPGPPSPPAASPGEES